MTSVLVVQHEPECPVDRVGEWLADQGLTVAVCRAWEQPLPELVGAAALVVLGGHMGAHDDATCAWLPGVKELLREAVRTGLPTLGICLGAQLLAVATGGRVEVGPTGIEAGVVEVAWREEAAGDVLVGGLPQAFPGPSMHLDAVTVLPPGAVWLGETGHYPHQVFRVGPRAWGVQFHPEASAATFTAWAHLHDGEWAAWGLDGAEVVAAYSARAADVAASGAELTRRFAALVAAG